MKPHGNARHDGWWYRATNEQRLAQIDAGIELGMTAKQVAMNCGCAYEVRANGAGVREGERGAAVIAFAISHGRNFPRQKAGSGSAKRIGEKIAISRAKAAMRDGYVIEAAFDIFNTRKQHSDSLFDEVPQ